MKILIVATYFPPHATVAVVRVSRLVRYLLKQGHSISVLTNKMDERTEEVKNFGTGKIDSITEVVQNPKESYPRRSEAYKGAFRRCMKEQKPDCVFITCGSYETVPLCEICKNEFNTRCVLDYRDLWIFDMRSKKEFFSPKKLSRKLMFYPIERKAIASADSVITVTDGWADILRRVYRKYRDKIDVVYNGYDDTLFAQITDEERNKAEEILNKIPNRENAVILASFGKLIYYSYDYGKMLLTAAASLLKKYPNLMIFHIGEKEKDIDKMMQETGFPTDHFICTGFCPYQIGMEMLKNADVNLLVDIRKQAIGTKIYDYIYANRPVLYVGAPNTYLSELVSGFSGGYACNQLANTESAISEIIEKSITKLTDEADTVTYSRSIQNKKLEKFIVG